MGKYHDGIKEIPFPMCLAHAPSWVHDDFRGGKLPPRFDIRKCVFKKADATGRVILLLSDFSEDEVEKRFLFDKDSS